MLCLTLYPVGLPSLPEGTYLDITAKRPCDIRIRVSKSSSSRVVLAIEADKDDVFVLRSDANIKR